MGQHAGGHAHGALRLKLLIALPDRDFDVTEVSLPWQEARRRGVEVVFATERGAVPACDPLLLTMPLLGASRSAIRAYHQMQASPAFQAPLPYAQVVPEDYAGLLLPGGHAPGMRQYLECQGLYQLVRGYAALGRPLGAICHGPLVLARAGLLRGRRVTALPKILEWIAYALTFWKLGTYYRTYPEYVEDEVKRHGGRYVLGNLLAPCVVQDGPLLTARWPYDAARFAQRLVDAIVS